MINSGAILSASMLLYMVQPELSTSEKFEFVQNYFERMAGGMPVGFQNTIFLSERESSDRNHALAFFMRENKCFPQVPNPPRALSTSRQSLTSTFNSAPLR